MVQVPFKPDPKAFDLDEFDVERYVAKVVTSAWRPVSERVLEPRRNRLEARKAMGEDVSKIKLPTYVWYLHWQNLTRVVAVEYPREIVPPEDSEGRRSNSLWARHIAAFQKCGFSSRQLLENIGCIEGAVFEVEQRNISFGNDIVARRVIVPIRLLSLEETAHAASAYEALLSSDGTVSTENRGAGRDEAPSGPTPLDVQAAVRSLLSNGAQLVQAELVQQLLDLFNPDGDAAVASMVAETVTRLRDRGVIQLDLVSGELRWAT